MRLTSGLGPILALAAAAALLPAPSLAAEAPAPADAKVIDACLASAKASAGRAACIGRVSSPCLEDAGTTAAMIACADRENRVWDARLNRDYPKLMALLPDEAKTLLRDIERAFVTAKSQRCGFDYVANGGGTMWSVSDAECEAEATARQWLWIADKIDMLTPH